MDKNPKHSKLNRRKFLQGLAATAASAWCVIPKSEQIVEGLVNLEPQVEESEEVALELENRLERKVVGEELFSCNRYFCSREHCKDVDRCARGLRNVAKEDSCILRFSAKEPCQEWIIED